MKRREALQLARAEVQRSLKSTGLLSVCDPAEIAFAIRERAEEISAESGSVEGAGE